MCSCADTRLPSRSSRSGSTVRESRKVQLGDWTMVLIQVDFVRHDGQQDVFMEGEECTTEGELHYWKNLDDCWTSEPDQDSQEIKIPETRVYKPKTCRHCEKGEIWVDAFDCDLFGNKVERIDGLLVCYECAQKYGARETAAAK